MRCDGKGSSLIEMLVCSKAPFRYSVVSDRAAQGLQGEGAWPSYEWYLQAPTRGQASSISQDRMAEFSFISTEE